MKCPECKRDTIVIDSRQDKHRAETRRRRQCINCDGRFTTYERRNDDSLELRLSIAEEALSSLAREIMRACLALVAARANGRERRLFDANFDPNDDSLQYFNHVPMGKKRQRARYLALMKCARLAAKINAENKAKYAKRKNHK